MRDFPENPAHITQRESTSALRAGERFRPSAQFRRVKTWNSVPAVPRRIHIVRLSKFDFAAHVGRGFEEIFQLGEPVGTIPDQCTVLIWLRCPVSYSSAFSLNA